MTMLKTLSGTLTLLALLALVACGAKSPSPKTAQASQSSSELAAVELDKAPDFTLENIDGTEVSLASMKGKVVIIDFWATWCPPCVKGIPEFVELYEQYNDQGLEVVGISVDRGGPGVVKKFVEKNKVSYAVAMADMQVVDDYEVYTGIPTTYIIDREGNVVQKVIGYQPKSFFEAEVKKLL